MNVSQEKYHMREVVPISLVHVEICLYLIKDRALHVKELAVYCFDVRTNDMHNQPILILPL